jgi:hypothetical protein
LVTEEERRSLSAFLYMSELYNQKLPGLPQYPTDRRPMAELALVEAYAWLEAQGLIVPTSDGSGGGRCIGACARGRHVMLSSESAPSLMPG